MKLEGDRVLGPRGDVIAEKIYGEWQTKDPAVLDFIKESEEVKVEKVRARNEKGQLMADDPSTPDVNEAWTTKVIKKVTRKKTKK
jgi:hypothetical protein